MTTKEFYARVDARDVESYSVWNNSYYLLTWFNRNISKNEVISFHILHTNMYKFDTKLVVVETNELNQHRIKKVLSDEEIKKLILLL